MVSVLGYLYYSTQLLVQFPSDAARVYLQCLCNKIRLAMYINNIVVCLGRDIARPMYVNQ